MSGHLTPAEIVIRPDVHVFLSPHYDDIALSSGGAAALAARAGRRPRIALIFGSEPDFSEPLSDFAEELHRGWGLDTRSVVAGRRAEEAAASAILGTSDQFLPFHDAIYREHNYTGNDQLFDRPVAAEADLPASIVAALDLSNATPDRTRVYAPLASGNHVDHQLAFEAGRLLARDGYEVWFYEDLPYSLKPERLERRLADLAGQVEVAALVDVSSVWATKIDAIMAYPSQLPTIFDYVAVGHSREQIDAAMSAYARALGGGVPAERFWRLTAGATS